MSRLRECQLGFARAVDDASVAAAFGTHIRKRGLDGARRIQVYRNNLFAALTGALGAVYPVTRRLTGDAFFEQTATRYVKTHHSRSGDIHAYGETFGAFLRDAPGVHLHPYLPDVARLEWGYHSVFHRSRAPALDIAALAEVPATVHERLRFRLQPAAALFASPYPVLQIWQANQPDADGGQIVSLDAGATHLLVSRDSCGVAFHPLTPAEHALLEQFSAGATLLEALQHAQDIEPRFDLGAALRRHVLNATLIGFRVDGKPVSTASPHHGG